MVYLGVDHRRRLAVLLERFSFGDEALAITVGSMAGERIGRHQSAVGAPSVSVITHCSFRQLAGVAVGGGV